MTGTAFLKQENKQQELKTGKYDGIETIYGFAYVQSLLL